jgi:ubiquitin-conjugating enzyme E2 J1
MDTEAKGQVGGLECDGAARRDLAARSRKWVCQTCGRSNAEILAEHADGVEGKEERVPEELKLAYREDLAPKREESAQTATSPVAQRPDAQLRTAPPRRLARSSQDAWLDKAIYIVTALLVFFILRKLLSFV